MVTSEFAFELRVCQWAERRWPGDDAATVVARQLGTASRRWDTIVLECDRDALERRARFGERRLDSDLLDVIPHAPTEWTWYRDALPDPGYPWQYVREAVHRAADRGILETRKRGNRIEIRRRYEYPDWVDRVVAIENKPDLDASAARALSDQMRRDVALGLADEVWVATAGTGASVEPILLEDLPVEVGLLALDAETGEETVLWHPRTLAVDDPGTRVIDRGDGASAARFEYADPDWKRQKRLEIAERAYERGWRSYVDASRPDCRHYELLGESALFRPHCAAKERTPTPRECREACSAFEPEPPAWRTRGWPISGGPGKGIERLLARRRRRQRPGLGE